MYAAAQQTHGGSQILIPQVNPICLLDIFYEAFAREKNNKGSREYIPPRKQPIRRDAPVGNFRQRIPYAIYQALK